MDNKKIYKIVNEEITKALLKEGGMIGDLVSKFYMFIIKNDLKSAKKQLEENPELINIAKKIKQDSEDLAKIALQDKAFLKFLFDLKDKE